MPLLTRLYPQQPCAYGMVALVLLWSSCPGIFAVLRLQCCALPASIGCLPDISMFHRCNGDHQSIHTLPCMGSLGRDHLPAGYTHEFLHRTGLALKEQVGAAAATCDCVGVHVCMQTCVSVIPRLQANNCANKTGSREVVARSLCWPSQRPFDCHLPCLVVPRHKECAAASASEAANPAAGFQPVAPSVALALTELAALPRHA